MAMHPKLDALLKDGRISIENYLLVKDAVESEAPEALSSEIDKRVTGLFKGIAINFGVQCLVMCVIFLTMILFQEGGRIGGNMNELVFAYFIAMPIAIAGYHFIFLPAGELTYQVLHRFARVSRLPVYIGTAWVLLVPMLILVQPYAS